ncbi:MAG: hypothetical protein ABIB71_04615 [Candidatus Woesearchaeota archaeon]
MVSKSTFRAFAVLSIIIILSYAFFYLYSTAGSDSTIKISGDDPCTIQGGRCSDTCQENEDYDGTCQDKRNCCKIKTEGSESDRYFYNLALRLKELSECSQIVNEELSAECKLIVLDLNSMDFALKYNDINYCDKIASDTIRPGCITEMAIAMASPSYCNRITGASSSDMCHKSYAVANKDSTICANDIKDESIREMCYKAVAVELKDSSKCDMITNIRLLEKCVIDSEARKLLEGYADCTVLEENECIKEMACNAFYTAPKCEGCPLKEFESCIFDLEQACILSKGKWEAGTCECLGNSASFGSYGCIECQAFEHQKAKEICEGLA